MKPARRLPTMTILAMAAGVALGGCASAGGTQVLVQPELAAEDLQRYEGLTVYEFLRRHSKVHFFDRQTAGEVMYAYSYGGSASLSQGGLRPSVLRVNDQEVLSPVEELRSIYVDQVETLEILKATEYSGRYGGPGRRGAVLITLKSDLK